MQIDISLDVFKALTALLEHEGQTHNDVIRDLLQLDSIEEPDPPESPLQQASDLLGKPFGAKGFYSRGLLLPEGTELRARYKQREFYARIVNERWIDEFEQHHTSPSAAATAVTGNSVNGWRFWEAKRPGDRGWRRLDVLASESL